MARKSTDILGWFDEPGATTPAHDPGLLGVDCPVCGELLIGPLVTISMLPEGFTASYFFRAHKGCWDGVPASIHSLIESFLIEAVKTANDAEFLRTLMRCGAGICRDVAAGLRLARGGDDDGITGLAIQVDRIAESLTQGVDLGNP